MAVLALTYLGVFLPSLSLGFLCVIIIIEALLFFLSGFCTKVLIEILFFAKIFVIEDNTPGLSFTMNLK